MRDHLRTLFVCALGVPIASLVGPTLASSIRPPDVVRGGTVPGASVPCFERRALGSRSIELSGEGTAQVVLDRDDVARDAHDHGVPHQTPG